jgi:hypothetical protein
VRDAALQKATHDRAGDHDLRVRQSVSDLSTVALDLDET